MKSQDSTKFIMLAVIGIIVFFLYRSCSKNRTTTAPVARNETSNAQAIQDRQPEILAAPQNLQQYNKDVDKRRAAAVARERVGMQSMELDKNRQGQYELKFDLIIKNLWCKAGDYETIKSVLLDYKNPIILVSLESTSSTTRVSKPVRMNLLDFGKGLKHTFVLDGIKANSNESLALRICSDRKKKDTCSDVKPVDHKILNQIGHKANSTIKDDVIFYLQNLYVKDGEIVSQGAMDYSKTAQKRLNAQLKKEGFETEAFAESWKMSRTIRSEPIRLVNGKLTAYISRNDPKCTLE